MQLPRLFSPVVTFPPLSTLTALLIGFFTLSVHAQPESGRGLPPSPRLMPPPPEIALGDPASAPAELQLQPDPSNVRSVSRPPTLLDGLPAFKDNLDNFPRTGPNDPRNESLDLPVEPNFAELKLIRRGNPILVPDGPNPTEDAARELNARMRFRDAKIRAMKDPEVQASLLEAQKARSDREMREALRRHYTRLFSLMRASDGTLSKLIQERERETMAPLIEKLSRQLSR